MPPHITVHGNVSSSHNDKPQHSHFNSFIDVLGCSGVFGVGPSPATPTREDFRTRHSLEFGGARRYSRDSRNRDFASGKPSPMGRRSLHGHLRGGTPFYMPGALFSQGKQKGRVLGVQPNLYLGKGDPCFCRRAALGYQRGGQPPARPPLTPQSGCLILSCIPGV